jgi:hypothetical protein
MDFHQVAAKLCVDGGYCGKCFKVTFFMDQHCIFIWLEHLHQRSVCDSFEMFLASKF